MSEQRRDNYAALRDRFRGDECTCGDDLSVTWRHNGRSDSDRIHVESLLRRGLSEREINQRIPPVGSLTFSVTHMPDCAITVAMRPQSA